jgi:uncharacterized protein (TIGR02145 family)
MRNVIIISRAALFILSTFLISSCNKDDDNAIKDGDGNIYTSVKIGTQEWLVENLKTTKYRNGESIPNVTDKMTWINLTTGAYCDYNNEVRNSTTYGRLYNWYAVNDSRNISPSGWHIPTDADWTTLENYLIVNGYNYNGTTTGNDIAKALASIKGWNSSTVEGAVGNIDYSSYRNKSGFTGLPGGCRLYSYLFDGLGFNGFWWSSSESSIYVAWYRYIYFDNSHMFQNDINKAAGFSVRCVQD